jgi:hypothetical protein
MGSRKQSTALAMLMTLMNVRLGYWTPTPNKRDWQLPQARLWPFYLMREFFSQTNDLSTYCYLTDGGHFDNVGLYSLVERGCKYIVVSDSSEDLNLSFADLGEAIRRCRIDFRAEIDLDITPLRLHEQATGKDDSPDRAPMFHSVVGAITYSKEHAASLGWQPPVTEDGGKAVEDASDNYLTGIIVYFKPILPRAEVPVDVRQYGFQNTRFPHQSTIDQWFDESQFESYRKLGETCARQSFGSFARSSPGEDPLTVAQVAEFFHSLPKKVSVPSKKVVKKVAPRIGLKEPGPQGV